MLRLIALIKHFYKQTVFMQKYFKSRKIKINKKKNTSSDDCFNLETAYWRTTLLVKCGVNNSKASTASIGSHLLRRSSA